MMTATLSTFAHSQTTGNWQKDGDLLLWRKSGQVRGAEWKYVVMVFPDKEVRFTASRACSGRTGIDEVVEWTAGTSNFVHGPCAGTQNNTLVSGVIERAQPYPKEVERVLGEKKTGTKQTKEPSPVQRSHDRYLPKGCGNNPETHCIRI